MNDRNEYAGDVPKDEEQYAIQLERFRNKYITLNKEEFKLLNRFSNTHHDLTKIRRKDYEHLPKKVRRIIVDWITKFPRR